MKRLVILHTLLGVSLFTACQQERLGETETAADAAELKLTVLAGNFLPADNASTRAIDNGSVTVFENGDRVAETEICYVPDTLEDMIFQNGEGKRIHPYRAEDGSFRYILPAGYTGTLRWFYTYLGKRFSSTIEISAADANTRYSKAHEISFGKYTLDEAKAGDFLCVNADGTVYLVPNDTGFLPGRKCIGIVFKSGTGNGDNAGNYGGKPGSIHGYAVALEDASSEAGAWGIRNKDVQDLENVSSLASGKYDGYSNTLVVRNQTEYQTTDVSNPTANDQYWAFKAASEYGVTAPENTSGWYLPSIAQLQDIYNLPDRSVIFSDAGGENFKTGSNEGRYWSSTEYNHYDAWYCQFNNGSSASYAKSNNGGNYLRPSYVRAVLTF